MTQVEIVRPADMTQDQAVMQKLFTPAITKLVMNGNTAAARMAAAKHVRGFLESGKATLEYTGLDETYEQIRDQFRKFGKDVVEPHAHGWHMRDELIPDSVVKQMGEMGVFGLTIPEEFGGLGTRQDVDVRRLRRTQPRLYRRRLARHAFGNRSGAAALVAARAPTGKIPARRSPPAKSCPPPSLPNQTPAPTSARFAPAPRKMATPGRSPATRPGSRTPRAQT